VSGAAHERDDMPAGLQHADQVRRNDSLPLVGRELVEGCVLSEVATAVDEDVDPSVVLDDLFHCRGHLGSIGDVDGDRARLVTRVPHDVDNPDTSAGGDKAIDDRGADSAGPACDDGDSFGQVVNGSSLV
jgi:hypothetical protein